MSTHVESALALRCDRKELLAALQIADSIAPTNSAKPILTNLLLDVRPEHLEIVATDQQIGMRAVLRRLQIDSPGSAVLPARKLVGILKESQSAVVHLQVEQSSGGSQVGVELSDGDYRIPAVVGETFPPASVFPSEAARVTVPGIELERMLRQTSFAVDRDRSSLVLSGVLVRVAEGEVVLAATDGKVLAEATLADAALADQNLDAIAPAATMAHLARILSSQHPQQVEIAVHNRLLFIRTVIAGGDDGEPSIQLELSSRLVDGSYPSYRNALPREPYGRARFDTAELASAVRRTALMTSTASRAIVLDLTPGAAVLSNLNNATGSARIPLGCTYDGPPQRYGLNVYYLGEILRAYDGDQIEFELNGSGKGLIARGAGVTFLIMPITLPS